MSRTLELTQQLISCPSITPNDAGCQDIISERLKALGFTIEFMHFCEVKNLWARIGNAAPLLVFAGHTDVVPPGPSSAWESDPFIPDVRGDYLFGRGAADMKSGLASMIIATENFLKKHPRFTGSIAFLITSDEEGASVNGTKRVMQELNNRNELIDYCIVGEANSDKMLGDQIRIGRRGSLTARLRVLGKQGHVAYPHLAQNPIHLVSTFLQELTTTTWDNGNESFPPTSLQISNINSGTGAANVIPGSLEMIFNFRFSNVVTAKELQERVAKILEKHQLDFDLQWDHSGDPFLTKRGKLLPIVQTVINQVTGLDPVLSTGGGTSDGRFIAPAGAEVIEVGPCNGSIHQANEHVRVPDLDRVTAIYELILEKLFLLQND